MWDWTEISRHGGVTASLLADMHNRAHSRRRKLDHNTYSHLFYSEAYTFDGDLCPDCGKHVGWWGVDGPPPEEGRKWAEPCVTCALFVIKLHGNTIASVSSQDIGLHVNKLRTWNTLTTRDRVNTILSGTPFRLYSRNNEPHLRHNGTGEEWRLTPQNHDSMLINLDTMFIPDVYTHCELVKSPIVHPNLPGEGAYDPRTYYVQEKELFNTAKHRYLTTFSRRVLTP